MASLNNLKLKYLGIVSWKLRYPIVLQDNIIVQLLSQLKLLVISDVLISLNDLFVQDVIRSMNLNQTEIHIITVDQINTLVIPKNFLRLCWWIGTEVLYNYRCFTVNTPSLSVLKHSISAKRYLWNQISLLLSKVN